MSDTLNLDDDPRSAKRARDFVATRLAGHERATVENATLMVSELVTNSLKHATGGVTLTVTLTDERVRVDVVDPGPAHPVVRSPTPDDPTGRGLLIVSELSDEWGFTPSGANGNHVWFVIGLDRSSSAGSDSARQAGPRSQRADAAGGKRARSRPTTRSEHDRRAEAGRPDATMATRRGCPARCLDRRHQQSAPAFQAWRSRISG
jgi:anti-sigma regulatory factor (Ser/Thr protein kinase)